METKMDKTGIGHDNKCREKGTKSTIGHGERFIRHGQDGAERFTRKHPLQIRMHQYGMKVLVSREIRRRSFPTHGKEGFAPLASTMETEAMSVKTGRPVLALKM